MLRGCSRQAYVLLYLNDIEQLLKKYTQGSTNHCCSTERIVLLRWFCKIRHTLFSSSAAELLLRVEFARSAIVASLAFRHGQDPIAATGVYVIGFGSFHLRLISLDFVTAKLCSRIVRNATAARRFKSVPYCRRTATTSNFLLARDVRIQQEFQQIQQYMLFM